MYQLPYFTEKDQQKVMAFMHDHSFALITGFDGEFPVATQIPLIIEIKDDKIVLSGHMMKKTDHHLSFKKNSKVLVIFNGPHCYVSASWYNNPQSGSTWNYMSVHAKGTIHFTDEAGTYQAVRNVTNKYESADAAGAFNNIPQSYISPMLKAIVGFSIEVESIDNVFKLSQNKTVDEQTNIIAQLKKRGDDPSTKIALEIEKLIAQNQPA